jgi:hypothetical protein
MAQKTGNAMLPRWAGLALLASLGGCGSSVAVIGQGTGAALSGVAATTPTQTESPSSAGLVADNGTLAETTTVAEACTPGLHCAP